MAILHLSKALPENIQNPSSTSEALFFGETDGKLYKKDSLGVVSLVIPDPIPVESGSDAEALSNTVFVDGSSPQASDSLATTEEVIARGSQVAPFLTLKAARDRSGGYYIAGDILNGGTVITNIDPTELENAVVGDLVTKRETASGEAFFAATIVSFTTNSITLSAPFTTAYVDASGTFKVQDTQTFRVIPVTGLKKNIIVLPADYTYTENAKYMDYANYDFGGGGLARAGLDWIFHPRAKVTMLAGNDAPLFSTEYQYSYKDIAGTKITIKGSSNVFGQMEVVNLSNAPVFKAVRRGSALYGENRQITQFNEEGNIFEFFSIISIANVADILVDLIHSYSYQIYGAFGQSGLITDDARYLYTLGIKGNFMYNSVGKCIDIYEASVKVDVETLMSGTSDAISCDGTVGSIRIGKITKRGASYQAASFYGFDLDVDCNQLGSTDDASYISLRGIKQIVHNDDRDQGKVNFCGNNQNVRVVGGIVNISGAVNRLTMFRGDAPNLIGSSYFDAPDVTCDMVTKVINVDKGCTLSLKTFGYKSENAENPDGPLSSVINNEAYVIIDNLILQSRNSFMVANNATLVVNNAILGAYHESYPVRVLSGGEVTIRRCSVNGTKVYNNTTDASPLDLQNTLEPNKEAIKVDIGGILNIGEAVNNSFYPIIKNEGIVYLNASVLISNNQPINGSGGSTVTILQGGVSMDYTNSDWMNSSALNGVTANVFQSNLVNSLKKRTI